jgi:hypothetical protein
LTDGGAQLVRDGQRGAVGDLIHDQLSSDADRGQPFLSSPSRPGPEETPIGYGELVQASLALRERVETAVGVGDRRGIMVLPKGTYGRHAPEGDEFGWPQGHPNGQSRRDERD